VSDDAPKKTTSGIGGTWIPNKEGEVKPKYAPKVSTWGVFERPADISKAYGGGRQVGVGGYQPSEEEMAKKRAETDAKLAAYRKSLGADSAEQDAHEEEIRAAQKEAQQMTRYGATKAALETLEKVRPWLCVKTELGGELYLELGMAYIAEKQEAEAKTCFKTLLGNPDRKFKRLAQQMLFQEEAQSFLKVSGESAGAEFAKLSRAGLGRSLGVANDKRYAPVFDAISTSAKRPPVATLSEARMVLRSAAVRRDDAGAPQRITQALEYVPTVPVRERLPPQQIEAEDEAEAAEAAEARARRLLQGEWLLGFTVRGASIAFAPPEASQQLKSAEGQYERLAPSSLGLVKTRGGYEVRAAKGGSSLEIDLGVDSCTLGPFPVPFGASGGAEKVLLLDSLMCITQEGGGKGSSVWVRPAMRRSEDGENDFI